MSSAPTSTAAPTTAPARNLALFPIGAFASVMGTAGLASAFNGATVLWGVPIWIGRTLAILALLLFTVVLFVYLTKAVRHRAAVITEWQHPVQAAFVATSSMALLVLANALYGWLPALASALWWVGAVAQAAITVLTVRTWIADAAIQQVHVHPAWFLPAVGNLVAPIAGAHIGAPVVVWYFFGVGIVYWLGLLPIVLSRLFTAGTLPPALVPTLAIMVAPPSVAALSWVNLGGSWSDPMTKTLIAVIIFQIVVLAVQLPALRATPFAISSWAYTFPLATATSVLIGSTVGDGFDYGWLAAVMLAATTLVVAAMGWRTAVAVARGQICRRQPA